MIIPSHPASAIGRPGHDDLEWVSTPKFVYFVFATESGRVKIGLASDLRNRFHSLQTASPERLEMLGWVTTIDAEEFEAEMHECWSRLRVRGEWFRAHPDLLQFIRETRDPIAEEPDDFAPARPQIPDGVLIPTGNSRKNRMARYCLARGLDR